MRIGAFLLRTYERVKHNKRRSQVFVLVSFFLTFIVVRTITYLQLNGLLPNQTWQPHIHHLVPGIFLLLFSGYMSISFWNIPRIRVMMSVFFGIGAALTIDEFALWLHLRDVYWAVEGRISVDAVIFTMVIFTLAFIISEAHDHSWMKKFRHFLKTH